ncbi:13984_t:CDS:2, partial [Racocetra persica]
NEINKQLGRGGENKVILLRQTLKSFLKKSLESMYEIETISENKKLLEGGRKCPWNSLEKLPTTNNHLEGMNEYLKNNQLNRFQRSGHLLRADILYIALVYEVIPNILT